MMAPRQSFPKVLPTIICSASIILLAKASAQVMVYGVADPAAAALAHLNGPNVVLSNAFSQTIDPQQVGAFSDSTASIGLDTGLVVSTGLIYGLMGPNSIPNMSFGGGFAMYDPDLMTMSLMTPGGMFDPGILQMDLVPAGDTLEVRYVFSSEEYDEYVCSDKDDRMGIFLSGPGLSGPFSGAAINMATLPASGLPVSVNTLNRGLSGAEGSIGLCGIDPAWLADTIYYINNDFGLGTQLDAYSVVLTARAVVMPGMTYHLKLAIADVNDGNFDSAVFLPEGAIRCTDVSTALPTTGGPDARCFWYDEAQHAIQVRGLSSGSAPQLLEAFDASGRLIASTGHVGLPTTLPLDQVTSGLVFVRARVDDRWITGRVIVP